jgi:chaperonin cofactor prefoldin
MESSKMMTKEGHIQAIAITKEELEEIIDTDITTNDWNTFALKVGNVLMFMDAEKNALTQDLIDEFEDTGIWREHELGNLFACANPSFEELSDILRKYDVELTEEMWNEIYNNVIDESDNDSGYDSF